MEIIKTEKKLTCNVKQMGSDDERVLRFVVTDETQDSDDDILLFEGWNLSRFVKNPVGLYMHQYDKPAMAKAINIIKDEMNKTIMIDYKFPSFDEMSSDERFVSDWAKLTDTIYNLYKNGYMNAVSVGFDSADYIKNPNSQYGRIYKNKNLLEVSFVSVPANPNALMTAKSKGFIDDEGIKALKRFEKGADEVEKTKGKEEEKEQHEEEKPKEDIEDKKNVKAGNTLNAKNRENLMNMMNMLNNALNIANQMMENYQEPMEEVVVSEKGNDDKETKGSRLARLLNDAIEDMITDDMSRADILQQMASAAGISVDTVRNIVNGDIIKPPENRLEAFADVLNISSSSLMGAAERDGETEVTDRGEHQNSKTLTIDGMVIVDK